jgi:hypothetical protein
MKPNAAPEWQAKSLGCRSKEVLAACPLEGIVRRVASQQGSMQYPPQLNSECYRLSLRLVIKQIILKHDKKYTLPIL